MRKVLGALMCAIVTATLLGLANPAPATAADNGAEASFVAQINSARAQKGVAPLQVYGELVGVARGWTDQMVAAGGISHNPNLANEVTANWSKLGENVGEGPSVNDLMAAFLRSPAHYRNIVDPDFNYIGVGVSYAADGTMFVTQNFMKLADDPAPAPAPAPEPPAAAPAPAPAPAAAPAPAPAADPAPAAPAAAPAPVAATPAPAAAPLRVKAVLVALRSIDG